MTTDTFAQNKLPETIVKRNGTEERFDRSKISVAIYNALRATGEYKDTDINEFTGKLLKSVLRELKTRNDGKLHVEDVQDIIEDKLMDKGLHKTARYFIKYRFLHKINRDKAEGATLIDCNQTTEEYIGFSDWRIKANANTTYSNAGLVNNTAGKVVANYWLDKIYSPEEGAAHRNGDYHIHDLDCLTGYCFTGDTRVALLDGTNPTFTELVDMYGDGKPFWVISRDKHGNIVPGNAHHPRLVKRNAELMEITISGGAKIVCTPDHEFMLYDGSYRQAKDLRPDESLMPIYIGETLYRYAFVRDGKKGGTPDYLHRIVGAWKEGITDMRRLLVHHINGNKRDNRPENLEVMTGVKLSDPTTEDAWKNGTNVARPQDHKRGGEMGEFYNHTVVSKRYLEDRQDVYCLTVDEHENFALEAGVFVHNCAGWNLRTLLSEGFNGVRSRVNSRPPKHFREALGQMANFLGILQSEWAGAQAFSSFDTFLAPYVFRDKLPFKEVKKAIRSFVYNLNVPSRWGQCVNSSYKCLRGDGKWVSHQDLKVGDSIYVVDVKTGALKKDTVTHVNVFSAPETMHRYSNEHGFSFDVTPNHRVIYKTGSNPFAIKESSELITKKGPVYIPISSWSAQTPESFMGNEYDIDDELLEFITFIMCDGCIVSQEGKSPRLEFYKSPSRYGCDRFEELCAILNIDYSVSEDKSDKFEGSYCNKYRLKNNEVVSQVISILGGDKHKCPDFMSKLSPRQAYIVLDTWVMLDGNFDGTHWKMQADTREIQEMLAFLTVITGKAAALKERVIGDNKAATAYTNIYKRGCRECTIEEVRPKESTVWCPTTNTGTFVCMTDEGYIFLTGNSPFTNVTIDWTVPADLKEDMPIRGCVHLFDDVKDDPELIEKAKERGVESPDDMSYKHFQPEMNVIQKAYYEVMTEGDSTGQPFTFPIPTVNITEDFDWDGENVPILFENAAKIGSSYFQNFVGSQYKIDENGNRVEDDEAYKPSAVRSMCPLALDTEVLTDKGNVTMKDLDPAIHKIYSVGGVGKWNSFTKSPVYTNSTVYKITFENGVEVEMSSEHLQPILEESGERNVVARELQPGMRCLFISNPDTEDMLGGESQITSVEKVGVKATQCVQVDSEAEADSFFLLANGLVTHNCRLQLDLNELRKRGNGLFGSAESTGSIGVVTINLARLGYRFKGDKEGLYKELDRLMDMAKSTLEKKRKLIAELYDRGLYPYTKRYLPGGFINHFSTIGVNGGNEMIRNFTNDEQDITTEWGAKFAEDLLNHIRERMKEFQKETGNLYNLEATPAEGTTHRFAREDAKRYPDIIQAGKPGQNYYTNSSQLPSWYTQDLFKALKMQDNLQTRYTGGTVFHMYMSEAISSPEACRDIVRKVLTNFKMPYITVTPLFSVCEKHGYLKGQHEHCPLCDEEILEKYSE